MQTNVNVKQAIMAVAHFYHINCMLMHN